MRIITLKIMMATMMGMTMVDHGNNESDTDTGVCLSHVHYLTQPTHCRCSWVKEEGGCASTGSTQGMLLGLWRYPCT